MTLAVVGSACQGGLDFIRDPGADYGIFFPRYGGSLGAPGAELRGRLLLKGACLLIESSSNSDLYLALWPPGSRPRSAADSMEIRTADGTLIGTVDDAISVGGGEIPDEDEVRRVIGRQPPSDCRTGKYWAVAGPNP
jgi:hypothetical protein